MKTNQIEEYGLTISEKTGCLINRAVIHYFF